MPAKKDPAAELAGQMLAVLEAQRRLGPDSYPPTLRRLAELTDPGAADDLVLKAAGKKKPFGERALVARAKDLDAPVALAEDAGAFAANPRLLEFALDRVCSAAAPTADPAKLKGQVPIKLRPPFEAEVWRRIDANDLPPGVGLLVQKGKRLLHLQRYPLPKAPEVALAEKMVELLRDARGRGDGGYPLLLSDLIARAGGDAATAGKARAQSIFKQNVLLAVTKKGADTPAALAEDRERVAASPQLLEAAVRAARSEATQIMGLADLRNTLARDSEIRDRFENAAKVLTSAGLPAAVGRLLQKNKPLFFLMEDVQSHAVQQPAVPADFARAFDEAFERLDRERGHNSVSVVDLRRELPYDRATFDAGLMALRHARRYSLGGAEGRGGLSPEEQRAGILEDGSLLLHVSRKLT